MCLAHHVHSSKLLFQHSGNQLLELYHTERLVFDWQTLFFRRLWLQSQTCKWKFIRVKHLPSWPCGPFGPGWPCGPFGPGGQPWEKLRIHDCDGHTYRHTYESWAVFCLVRFCNQFSCSYLPRHQLLRPSPTRPDLHGFATGGEVSSDLVRRQLLILNLTLHKVSSTSGEAARRRQLERATLIATDLLENWETEELTHYFEKLKDMSFHRCHTCMWSTILPKIIYSFVMQNTIFCVLYFFFLVNIDHKHFRIRTGPTLTMRRMRGFLRKVKSQPLIISQTISTAEPISPPLLELEQLYNNHKLD